MKETQHLFAQHHLGHKNEILKLTREKYPHVSNHSKKREQRISHARKQP